MDYGRWGRWAAEIKVNLTRRLSRQERIFLVSDLHIGDGSSADLFGGKDGDFIAFLDHVAANGDKLVILGDAIDFYVARSFDRVLRAHKRVLRRLKELADAKEVLYVHGNHDEDIVIYEDLLNFSLVERLVLPPDILVLHGHEYDLYFHDEEANAWGRWLATIHAQVEKVVGSPLRVPLATYDNRANRIMHWICYRGLRAGEMWASFLGRIGLRDRAKEWRRWVDYWNRSEQGDLQGLFREVSRRLPEISYRTLVCGHSHQPGVVRLDGKTYVNTGTWTRDLSTYVLWDGNEFVCKDWRTGARIGDELYRPFLEKRAPLPLKAWYREHHRGGFRFEFDRDPMALPPATQAPGNLRSLPRSSPDSV